VSYRRGFKSEANGVATEIRGELGLGPMERLDPWILADHLAIPILPLSGLAEAAPMGVNHLTRIESSAFSAVTVFRGPRRTIVHNDAHAPGRRSSNVTHELSHGLLLHPPTAALDDRGCRLWDQTVEDEANWLAGALLIPEDATLVIARRGISLSDAAAHFGVSEKMVEYRLNVTGARLRVARAVRRIAT
jgi:Zn-dependent peptidase ImmA (M78 family)